MKGEGEKNKLTVEELLRLLSEKDAIIETQRQKITNLSFENQKLKASLFGKKSEKLSRTEETYLLGFNEIEVSAPPEKEQSRETKKTSVRSHSRAYGGRKPLPANLPRRVIEHDLDDKEKFCSKGHALKFMGNDTSERLHIVPMTIEVEQHVRKKYVCPVCSKKSKDSIADSCEPEIKMAPQAPSLIPGSILTVGLFVFIIISKFCDALPFYRLGHIFKRFGIDITRQTMAAWSSRIAKDQRRLRKILYDELRSSHLIHIDETTVQVLKEKGRAATTKSYMWVYRGEATGGTVVIYEYRTTREGKFLKKRLRGFRGVFVADAYDGYNHLEKVEGLIRAGCWAHVRRKFFEVHTYGKPTETSGCFLDQIGELYRLEDECREMSPILPGIRRVRSIPRKRNAANAEPGEARPPARNSWRVFRKGEKRNAQKSFIKRKVHRDSPITSCFELSHMRSFASGRCSL